MRKVLVVAAHPDDEILGCGGAIAKLSQESCEVYTLILGEGITSRDKFRDVNKRRVEIENLKNEAREANLILGIKEVFFYDFPDNRFDTVPFLDLVKAVEEIKDRIKPEIIFTHFQNDLNVDHRLCYRAVITATRPLKGETVKEIYSFEALSSTDWNFPLTFSPDYFIDISSTVDLKLQAMSKYKSELREYPHPRSLKGIELKATYWGMLNGVNHSEAFKVVRINH